MKRKIAVMLGVAVMAVMLSACGGSTSSASSSAEEAAEEVEEETDEAAEETEDVVEQAEEAMEEAMEAADEAVAEAGDTVEAAVEDANAAATEAAAAVDEAETAAAETADEAATEAAAAAEAASEDVAADANLQLNMAFADVDLASALTVDESKQLEVTEVTEEDAEDKGIGFSNGEMYEYTAFKVGDTGTMKEFMIFYSDPATHAFTNMVDLTHFYKSSGVTESQIRSLDLSQIYPGIYDMDCARASLNDCGDYYELIIAFINLDQPDNIIAMRDSGIFTVPNYTYGQKLDVRSFLEQYRNAGAIEMSDYDLAQENINP